MSERRKLIKEITVAFDQLEPSIDGYPSRICNESGVYIEDMPIDELRGVADTCRSRLRMRNLDRAMRRDFNSAALDRGLKQPFPDTSA